MNPAHNSADGPDIALAVESRCTPTHGPNAPPAEQKFKWTLKLAVLSVCLFILAGIAEIGGGWLIFQTIRVQKPFWWAILGGVILIIYGFIPTFQPISNFGRVFAVYGG